MKARTALLIALLPAIAVVGGAYTTCSRLAEPEAGACVVTATELAAQHPDSRILFVRYFNEPLGHAYTLWQENGRVWIGDWRGARELPALAWGSAYVAATHAPVPIDGLIFSTAAFVR